MSESKNCETCGKEFTAWKSSKKRFCSNKCSSKYLSIKRKGKTLEEIYGEEKAKELRETQYKHLPKQKFKCKNCNKIFESSTKTRIFCSNKCHYEWKKGKSFEEVYGKEKADKRRETTSKVREGKSYEEIYGSNERAEQEKVKRRKPKEKFVCIICGKEEKVFPYIVKNKKYCSKECFSKGRENISLSKDLHDKGIDEICEILKQKQLPYVPIGRTKVPVPDIIFFKNNEIFAIEVDRTVTGGTVRKWRLTKFNHYKKIIHLSLKDEIFENLYDLEKILE